MNRSESLEWSFRSILGEELIQTPGVGGNDADSKMLWVTWIQMWVSVAVCDAQGWRRPVTVFRAATSSPESASRPPLEGKTSVGDSAPWTSSFCQGCPFLATGSWGKWTVRDPGQRQQKQWRLMGVGFPGDAVVKNPPANAGNVGSIPGLGRSRVLQSN